MPAEAIRINRRVLLQCSIGAPGLKQPFAQPQQNGALSRIAVIGSITVLGDRSMAASGKLHRSVGPTRQRQLWAVNQRS